MYTQLHYIIIIVVIIIISVIIIVIIIISVIIIIVIIIVVIIIISVIIIIILAQLPLGISIASGIRVGNALGAGNPKEAKRAAYISLFLVGKLIFN